MRTVRQASSAFAAATFFAFFAASAAFAFAVAVAAAEPPAADAVVALGSFSFHVPSAIFLAFQASQPCVRLVFLWCSFRRKHDCEQERNPPQQNHPSERQGRESRP